MRIVCSHVVIFIQWLKELAKKNGIDYDKWTKDRQANFEKIPYERSDYYFGFSRRECLPDALLQELDEVPFSIPSRFPFKELIDHLRELLLPGPIDPSAIEWFDKYHAATDKKLAWIRKALQAPPRKKNNDGTDSKEDSESKSDSEESDDHDDESADSHWDDDIDYPDIEELIDLTIPANTDKSGWLTYLASMVRSEMEFCPVCCEIERVDKVYRRQSKAEKGLSEVHHMHEPTSSAVHDSNQ